MIAVIAVLGTLLAITLLFLGYVVYCLYRLRARAAQREIQLLDEKDEAVDLALKHQKSKISGEDVAKFCPFSPEYPYNARDVVAVFDTWDYTVLVGKVEGEIIEIVFQEMKSGEYSRLSQLQHSLRECVRQGKVRWETWQLDKETGIWHMKV